MSRFLTVGIAALAVASLAACTDATVSPDNGPDAPEAVSLSVNAGGPEQVMAGEVIVKLNAGASEQDVASAHGLSVGEHGYKNAFVVMRGNAGAEHANAASLKGDSRVEYAEPNYLRTVETINPYLWAFRNPGGLNMKYSRGQTAGQPIPSSYASTLDADEDNVENYAAGGGDVVIGSIDTGVLLTHSEFTGRLISGQDWYNNDANPTDDEGHGTHTTGTMAGTTVGVAGVSGAGPHVRVYVQKVCGKRGCPTSAIVSAIRAAADYPGMVAMNLSLGGSSESQAEKDAIAYAGTKNVLVIASAGNDGTSTVSCPACDPNAISVASSTWQDGLASYSNYGAGLDITAPGGNCYSNTTPEGCIYSAYKDGGYAWMQGTSMAAPQVTGSAAVVASVTGLRGSALRSRLLSTTDNIGDVTHFGAGRLNTYHAVTGSTLPAGQ
jgi:subtilisin family serine protease